MPPIGLVNLHGDCVKYSDVIPSYKYEDWGQPLPKLIVFMREKRVYDGTGIFASATQLLAPLRVFWMEKRLQWYDDPKEQQATYLGLKTHLLFEQSAAYLEKLGWLTEIAMVVPIEVEGQKVLIGLMPDSVAASMDPATLFDYKVTKAWKAKKAKDPAAWREGGSCRDWTLQLSIYAWGLANSKHRRIVDEVGTTEPWERVVSVRRAILDMTLKDWSKDCGLEPMETYNVPLLSSDETEAWLVDRVGKLMRAGSGDESQIPDCGPDETWLAPEWTAAVKHDNWPKLAGFWKGPNPETVRKPAEARFNELKAKHGHLVSLQIEPPMPKRCTKFCAVSRLGRCAQYRRDFPDLAAETEQAYGRLTSPRPSYDAITPPWED